MSSAPLSDIGAIIKVLTSALPPAAQAAGAVTGTAVDVRQFDCAVLHVRTGAVSGAPTSFSVDSKLQKSDDGTTGWVDYVPPTPYPGTATAAIAQITAVATEKHVNVNLAGVNYIREVATIAFVGGAAPTINVDSTLVLGGAKYTPLVY